MKNPICFIARFVSSDHSYPYPYIAIKVEIMSKVWAIRKRKNQNLIEILCKKHKKVVPKAILTNTFTLDNIFSKKIGILITPSF